MLKLLQEEARIMLVKNIQQNRIEGQDINPHIYGQLIFDKEAKKTQWEKYSIFNKLYWSNWISAWRII